MARFGSAVLALAILCASRSGAIAQDLAASGGRDIFSLADCAAPINLRFVTETKPAAIRTGDIAPRPAASPPGWTVEWDKPVATDAAINEYVSAGHVKEGCPTPGLYSVPITIYAEDHAAAPLALTIIRVVDPALDIPASVTLAAEWLWGAPDPVPLLLRQTAAGAPDTRLSVLGGELKTAAGEGTGITLEPGSGSVIVKAAETARVMLAPTQPPPPGAYTAKLVVNGAAIKPGTTIDVTYKVRVASAYLLGVIALGILLGLVVNVRLAARVALDAALLTAMRAMQSLTRRAAPQRDPAVQQRLIAVASLLQSSLEESTTPDEVTARVAEAETQAKDIETKATEAAANLQQALATSRALFRPNGQALDDLLAKRLADPIAELDTMQRAADAGDVEQTIAKLQDYSRALPARLLPMVQGVLADASTDLAALGKLPHDLAATRDALATSIETVYAAQDLTAMIKSTDDLARRLRAWIDLVAPAALAALWREAARVLAANPALAPRLAAAADQAEQLRRTTRDPLDRLATLGAISQTVVACITDAAPGRADVADALANGDVVGAAHRLAGDAPARRMLPHDLAAEAAPAPSPALALPETGPVAVLRVKTLLPLDQDSAVVLRWITEPPPNARITWQCQPPEAATIQAAAAGATVRPKQAGFLTIALAVDGTPVAEARTYAGEAPEQVFYTVVAREGRFARAAITIATAALTAFAGYEIFVPTWFGTVGDVFSAFMWGFFGQFGLDRIRDLTKPLQSKTLSS